MILVTLQDLIKSKGYNQLRKELLALLTTYGFSATDWETGSESDVLLNVESKSLEELWAIVSKIAEGMHLDTATEGWLTLLAKSHYNVDRIDSEFTKGTSVFTLIGSGSRTISAGAIIVTDGDGHNYITDNAVPVTLTPAAPQAEIPLIAEQVGAAYNVAPGVITKIYRGPADISVINQGLPTPASVLGTFGFLVPPPGPFNLTGKTLNMLQTYIAFDGSIVYNNPIIITFPANYPTMNDVVTYLNSLGFFIGFNSLVAANEGGYLRISTRQKGSIPNLTVSLNLLPNAANLILGFSKVSDTKASGGYTTDFPATVYSAYLNPPFNVAGLTLNITYTDDTVTTNSTITFPATNYPDLQALISANQALFASKGLLAFNSGGRLAIETFKKGPSQLLIIQSTGTANTYFGFSTDPLAQTSANGYSSWITQEGRDEELDEALRNRCRVKWGITGMGTRDAFESWAREASPKVAKVAIYANQLAGVPKAGAVTIWLAGLNGGVDAATVLSVYNYILPKMPIMSDLYVGSVNAITLQYAGVLQILRKSATQENLTALKNKITAYSQSLRIGGSVKTETIRSFIYQQFDPRDVVSISLTKPAGIETTCQKNEVLVIQEDPILLLKMIAV